MRGLGGKLERVQVGEKGLTAKYQRAVRRLVQMRDIVLRHLVDAVVRRSVAAEKGVEEGADCAVDEMIPKARIHAHFATAVVEEAERNSVRLSGR